MIRRATLDDAATLARLNTHVQSWHATHYPEAFFPNPDPKALTAYFADRLSDPACTAFVAGDPATAYALCQLITRETSIFSPGYRRLMVDHIAVAPEARRQGQGRALLDAAARWPATSRPTRSCSTPGPPTPRPMPSSAPPGSNPAECCSAPRPKLAPSRHSPYL